MKKFFTLLFSLGLVAGTFAQSGRHQQDQYPGNNYQETQNSRYSQMDNNAYSNHNTYNRDYESGRRNHDEGYAYNNEDRGRHEGYRDDHDRRERSSDWRDRNHHDRDEHYDGGYSHVRVQRDYYVQPGFPLLQIVLGIGRR